MTDCSDSTCGSCLARYSTWPVVCHQRKVRLSVPHFGMANACEAPGSDVMDIGIYSPSHWKGRQAVTRAMAARRLWWGLLTDCRSFLPDWGHISIPSIIIIGYCGCQVVWVGGPFIQAKQRMTSQARKGNSRAALGWSY